MRNLTIYLAIVLCFSINRTTAQETFEDKAKIIADKIESITKDEKASLKLEIEAVNKQLENGAITNGQADEEKLKLAEARAKNIEARVAEAEKELRELIQQKIDDKVTEKDATTKCMFSWNPKDSRQKKYENGESRTTSQFVFALGINNLVTDGAVANSDFGYLRSHFLEWGITRNTRMLQENNLLHFKYGVSFMYNMLTATENRAFVDTGHRTILETHPRGLRQKDTYFKNVFVTVPMHIEFDFSKSGVRGDRKIFRTHHALRVGLGGFVGYNINSKQFLSYKVDGYRIKEHQKGNWNIGDWNYGVSAYVGYKETSLYLKYDLSPMFANNAVDQNNISLGVRFDLN